MVQQMCLYFIEEISIFWQKGLALHQKVVYDFHQKNSQILKDIPEEDIRLTIKTIYRIHDLMEQAHLLS